MKLRNHILLVALVIAIGSWGCTEYEVEVPGLDNFTIYEIDQDAAGNPIRGAEIGLSGIPVGETVRLVATTRSDIAVFWPGYSTTQPYGPSGTNTIIDSHAYADYGKLGANGITTTAVEGLTGYYLDYSWPDPGTYTCTVVLTNHGITGPDYEQVVVDFDVSVQ